LTGKEEVRRSSDGRDTVIRSIEALEAAREMTRGTERTRALKEAGRLRYNADLQGMVFVRRDDRRKIAA
jgi:hypothetical protein